ncbi:acyl-CoA oxidase [Heterostelium album PN500]|uniref:Acyl-CoA oxidase n=1 Tax=Heterostelium pallidum (strain ATCC 26659 / Pp 5 / PN500) TaxID=670386 RepID=D3BKX5_HETP5|nr:acyl-CoA oxidase [Heterostelium album PN500]EFA78555.1 acyl-CoA oxidase [Heterostelium album PN500]|eukprot:XP_020430679.1 acyl-CoA oxidase [Heterostelium album PN500]
MIAEFYSACIDNVDAKFFERIQNLSRQLLPNLSSNSLNVDDELQVNNVSGVLSPRRLQQQKIDVDSLKKALTAVRYREFKDDFPFSVKKMLLETAQYCDKRQQLNQPLIQTRLLIPIAKTISFDLYNRSLSKCFKNPNNVPLFARPYCHGTKALYTRHSLNTMMDCKHLLGRNDIDVIHGDKTGQLMNVAKFIVSQPGANMQPAFQQMKNESDPSKLFNFQRLIQLFKMRDFLKTQELKESLSKVGCQVHSCTNEVLVNSLNNVGTWAVRAAVAHLESQMLEENLRSASQTNNSDIVCQLILLDSLVKIQDDMGWIITNHLISEDQALDLPFIIGDACTILAPNLMNLVEAFDIPKIISKN